MVHAPSAGPAPILLFDGECNLCSRSVDFVLRRDRVGLFTFAAQQSSAGRELLARHGMALEVARGVVLVESGMVHQGADAVLRTLELLGRPWSVLAAVVRLVPSSLRNGAYALVARNRTRWFGRRDCRVPSDADRGRFLE